MRLAAFIIMVMLAVALWFDVVLLLVISGISATLLMVWICVEESENSIGEEII